MQSSKGVFLLPAEQKIPGTRMYELIHCLFVSQFLKTAEQDPTTLMALFHVFSGAKGRKLILPLPGHVDPSWFGILLDCYVLSSGHSS